MIAAAGIRRSRPTHRRARGFTLIEVMVVMVIIGVITGLATIALSDDRGDRLEREARRLAAVIDLAIDSSVLQGRTIGLRFEPRGYVFLTPAADGKWEPVEGDRQLRGYELPDSIELQFVNAESAPASKDDAQPDTAFLASGDAYPFELLVSHPELDTAYRIEVDHFGRMSFDANE